jgi:hypothetical protein
MPGRAKGELGAHWLKKLAPQPLLHEGALLVHQVRDKTAPAVGTLLPFND